MPCRTCGHGPTGLRMWPHRGLAGVRRAKAVVALARDRAAAAAGAAQAGAAAAAAGRQVGVRHRAAAAAGAAQAVAGAQRLAARRRRGALTEETEAHAVQARDQVAVLALLARARACRAGLEPCHGFRRGWDQPPAPRVPAVTPEQAPRRRPGPRTQSMLSSEGLHTPRSGSACPAARVSALASFFLRGRLSELRARDRSASAACPTPFSSPTPEHA